MLKITSDTNIDMEKIPEKLKKLVPFYKKMCEVVCDGLWENIHKRTDTSPGDDLDAMFNCLVSINVSAIGSCPSILALKEDAKLTVNTRKELLQSAVNEFGERIKKCLTEAIIDTIEYHNYH